MPAKTSGKGGAKEKKKEVKIKDSPVFVLPASLPECSHHYFPTLIQKRIPTPWKDILAESQKLQNEIAEYRSSRTEPISKSLFVKTECTYLEKEVLGVLIPALEETLEKARIWDVLVKQKCFFNGIDHIAQILWNKNPKHPNRFMDYHIFNMPWVREFLKTNPRPFYPKSWLWPEEYAATVIQKTVRQYFVQREEEVQEMRDFWRKLETEKEVNEIDQNPYLAKKFASEPSIRRLTSRRTLNTK